MMKEKSKSNMKLKPKSKSNSLKRSLSILRGGEEAQPKEEGKSSFFSFLNRREDKKPEDSKATNGPDMDTDPDADKGITFKSNKLLSVLSPSEAASVASSNGEAPASTWWFVFRVIIVLIVVLVFTLNLTGYLDNVVASIKQFFYTNIAPLLVSIGLMKPSPVVADRSGGSLPGSESNTGTNTINQLDKNIGTKPVTTTPPTTTSATASTPGPSHSPPTMPHSDPNLTPIPIQPNERRTPLQNKGESARPPASSPASYQEETSREKQKEESVKKALEYALKNQTPVADDATSSTQIPRSKSGYCYIGEDRGFRSCIDVSKDMKCISGDIFPTMDVCVNPRLRV